MYWDKTMQKDRIKNTKSLQWDKGGIQTQQQVADHFQQPED